MTKLAALLCAGLIALAACQTTAPRPEAQLIASCRAYTETLNALAVMRLRGQLSQDDIISVDIVRQTVNPICGADEPPADPDAALRDVEAGLYRMIEIEEANQ